jgi:hypothetical protein
MSIRCAVETDVEQIHALIESILGQWHADRRPDVLERALRPGFAASSRLWPIEHANT